MGDAPRRKRLKRQLQSTIIHFDYDCFYASVFESETPAYKSLPLAVQQKQIVVTCNYEARRRGLYKLMLIKEAKKICPDVVIVLGEDLTRFRNASKQLYAFLKAYSWNHRVERLGFDEVWMDVSDIVDYNVGLLNHNDLTDSFLCLSKDNPAAGFQFNAAVVAGQTYPDPSIDTPDDAPLDTLRLQLNVASHFAKHLRDALQSQKGYTCTVGVSTNKTLSKLVGNLHKPNNQTTLLPPYSSENGQDNVTTFIDNHEIGKIPGIGFKLAQKLRSHVLQRAAKFDDGLVYGGTKEKVLVSHVRTHPNIGPETLENILSGPGAPHGIGSRVWDLINGCDDAEVKVASEVPKQISIEDSYLRLDSMSEVLKELHMLAKSLLNRMHADLVEEDDDDEGALDPASLAAAAPSHSTSTTTAVPTTTHRAKRWVAYPKIIRLSTRPRPAHNPDGSRNRSFARISRSAPMPSFIFHLLLKDSSDADSLAQRLVVETLVPLFRKLHPERSGWNLSLVNVAVTNLVDAASERGNGVGRDIAKMFRRQDVVLRQWRVVDDGDGDDVLLAAPPPPPHDDERDGDGDGDGPVEVEHGHGDEDPATFEMHDRVDELREEDYGQLPPPPSPSHPPPRHHFPSTLPKTSTHGSEDIPTSSQISTQPSSSNPQQEDNTGWDSLEDDEDDVMDLDDSFRCESCGAIMPVFAVVAHGRWHEREHEDEVRGL